MNRLAAIVALGAGLVIGATTVKAAPLQLTSFGNFSLDATFANWGAPFTTITAGADDWTVRSHNYGSGYKYLGQEFDGTAYDTVQLKVNVSEGVAGFIVDLNDANNNGQQYAFYGLVPGGGTDGTNEYTMTMKIADGGFFDGSGVLDKSRISQMNIEIDPGAAGGSNFYTATWEDLSLISSTDTPEPTSLALLGLGAAALIRRRRA